MTYNVPDPANESPDRVAPDPTAPTLSSVVGPDGSGVEQAAGDDPPLPRHAAPEGHDGTGAAEPPQAQVAGAAAAASAPVADTDAVGDGSGVGSASEDRGLAADEPLRVAHEDSEEYEQFVTDPEAAEEATRARMDAQAEAEKAAAGITPAPEDS